MPTVPTPGTATATTRRWAGNRSPRRGVAERHARRREEIGISADTPDRQAEFDRRNSLGLPLLSDPDRAVARLFGVKRPGPLFNRRATFVIDTDRRVLAAFSSEVNMDLHADRALRVLQERAATT